MNHALHVPYGVASREDSKSHPPVGEWLYRGKYSVVGGVVPRRAVNASTYGKWRDVTRPSKATDTVIYSLRSTTTAHVLRTLSRFHLFLLKHNSDKTSPGSTSWYFHKNKIKKIVLRHFSYHRQMWKPFLHLRGLASTSLKTLSRTRFPLFPCLNQVVIGVETSSSRFRFVNGYG